jgi:hypothetical protein
MSCNRIGDRERSLPAARLTGRPPAGRQFVGVDDPFAFGDLHAEELAVEAYTYAYPLVLMDSARRLTANVGGPDGVPKNGARVNEFTHLLERPDHTFEHPPHPNPDTLCSSLWFDVSSEPLIVSVPDAGSRFFSLSLIDHWSDVFACPSLTGSGQTFGIVGPSWWGRLPPGIRQYRAPTALGQLVAQTEVGGASDVANVARFQAGLSATPLHGWGRLDTPARDPIEAPRRAENPVDWVARLRPDEYFSRFCELTRKNPPHCQDYPLLDCLRRIGIMPGRKLDFDALPLDVRTALEEAPRRALPFFEEAYQRTEHCANYWRAAPKPRATYATDYSVRAGAALAAFGSYAREEAASCRVGKDGNGDPFDSSQRYTLTFSRYAMPVARAFWSLSLYDDRQLLAENSRGRYSIGDRDDLAPSADGSLTLHIQRAWPGSGCEASWLPAPRSGGFSLDLRLYEPGPDVFTGRWHPPVVRRVE